MRDHTRHLSREGTCRPTRPPGKVIPRAPAIETRAGTQGRILRSWSGRGQRQEEAHARHTPLSASQSRSGPPPPLGGGVIVVLPPPSSGPRDCPHSDVTRQERYPFAEQSPSGYQRAAAIDDDDNYDDGWEEGEGDYYFILSAGRCGRELR
jgi:hypothetical protein